MYNLSIVEFKQLKCHSHDFNQCPYLVMCHNVTVHTQNYGTITTTCPGAVYYTVPASYPDFSNFVTRLKLIVCLLACKLLVWKPCTSPTAITGQFGFINDAW